MFRKYDIRGIVGQDFSIEDSYHIAQAISYFIHKQQPSSKTIIIGMDGRIHSPAIKEQVCRAFLATGWHVVFMGLCTTPALYFACHTNKVAAGVMITASHNPKEYNGFKVLLGTRPISCSAIEELKRLYDTNQYPKNLRSQEGTYREENLLANYINWLADHFVHLAGTTIPFLVDCGNGTGGTVLPQLREKLQLHNCELLYPEVDGTYPHHDPNPVTLANMRTLQTKLSQKQYIFGGGLDGDADRLGIMTPEGKLLAGDELLALFSYPSQQKQTTGVVMDIKCSHAVALFLNNHNIPTYITPTGAAFVKQKIQETNASMGGELSGHICFNDRYFGFDDGIYALFRFYELIYTHPNIFTVLKKIPFTASSSEIRIPCKEEAKATIMQAAIQAYEQRPYKTIDKLDGIKVETNAGWTTLRPANTEPALSIRFEGYTSADVLQLKQEAFAILSNYLYKDLLLQLLQ